MSTSEALPPQRRHRNDDDYRNGSPRPPPPRRPRRCAAAPATISTPLVDGTFPDAVTGLPAEHGAAPGNMRLSAADVAAIQAATQTTNGELIAQAVAMGKYVWAAL